MPSLASRGVAGTRGGTGSDGAWRMARSNGGRGLRPRGVHRVGQDRAHLRGFFRIAFHEDQGDGTQ